MSDPILESSNWTKTRAKIARTLRSDPKQDVTDLRAQLKAERLAGYIERVVAEAPPLTDTQRSRLAALLTTGANR